MKTSVGAQTYAPVYTPAERRLGVMLAVFTALLWGVLAIAMKIATDVVPVLTIVWFRFTFAFVALAFLVGLRDRRRLAIVVRPPGLAVIAAVGLTLNYLGYIGGLERTTPSNAQILVQVAPLLFAGVGVVLFRERLTRRQLIGAGIALAGFALFYRDQHVAAVVTSERLTQGNLLILGAAVAWVVYATLQKLLVARGRAPQDVNLVLYAVPAVALLLGADFDVLRGLSPGMWLLMAFLGANTLLAYGALGEAMKRLPAYQVSVIITCNPLITLAVMALLGKLELGWTPADRVGWLGYVAAGMVVVGVVRVLSGPPRRAADDTGPANERAERTDCVATGGAPRGRD